MLTKIQCLVCCASLLCILSIAIFPQSKGNVSIYTTTESKRIAKEKKKELETDPENAALWNDLGLELLYQAKFKDAEEALGKAVTFDPSNSGYLSSFIFAFSKSKDLDKRLEETKKAIEENPSDSNAFLQRSIIGLEAGNLHEALTNVELAIILNPALSPAYAVKTDIFVRKLAEKGLHEMTAESIDHLNYSIEALKQCEANCEIGKLKLTKEIEDRSSVVSLLEESIQKKKQVGPLSAKLKFLSKGRPSYSNTARKLNIKGTVSLAVVFKADKTIGPILVLKGLPGGLTNNAVNAAQTIKFEPEKRDGIAVDVIRTVVFKFSIY